MIFHIFQVFNSLYSPVPIQWFYPFHFDPKTQFDSELSNDINIVFILKILSKINHITYWLLQSCDLKKMLLKFAESAVCYHGVKSFEIVFIVWIWQ